MRSVLRIRRCQSRFYYIEDVDTINIPDKWMEIAVDQNFVVKLKYVEETCGGDMMRCDERRSEAAVNSRDKN